MFRRDRVKALREGLGYSQYDLAAILGKHQTWVCHIEIGRKKPSIDTFGALVAALQTNPGYLLGSTDQPLPEAKQM